MLRFLLLVLALSVSCNAQSSSERLIMSYPGPIYPLPIFNCTKLPSFPKASNVNSLRPQDIKAVMAVGDSISAGFAMHAGHLEEVWKLVEYRGDVFSIGGNPGQYTMPNFLKLYSPDLVGMAIGETLPLDAVKWKEGLLQPFDPKITHLNAAQSQAKIDAVDAQIDYLIEQLNTTYAKQVNRTDDWKVLTVFIGANNLCGACKNRSYSDPDYYETKLEEIIEKVYANIPRTFVNIITMFNISSVYPVAQTSEYCKFMWKNVVDTECMCLQGDATDEDRTVMDIHSVEFNQRIFSVASRWQAKQLPEFTVKVQPFTENLKVLGLSFISEFDCFHPSYFADAALAIGLWNNMLTPDAQKDTTLDPTNLAFKCPDENTFLH